MRSKFKPVLILTVREVRDQFRDWRIIFPILGLTLFFPVLMNYAAQSAVRFVSQYGASLLAIRFIPFSMMIVGFFPMTVSLVIGLESFAGEAERRTIEPLLSSPMLDWQLYLGKLISSLLFPLAASYLGILTYVVGIVRSTIWRPGIIFVTQIVLLTTVQALVMVSAAVVISTQTTSVRAANLLSSIIVIPMALLIQGEAIINFWGSDAVLWWVILGEIVVAVLLVRMGLAHFNRENLLGREIDAFNVRHSWNIFKNAFIGQAKNPMDWLKNEIPTTLRRLRIPFVAMLLLLTAGWMLGSILASRLDLPPEFMDLSSLLTLEPETLANLQKTGLISIGGAVYIWLHNLRVVLLASLAGIFTFGVLGAIILMLPMGLLGFLAFSAAQIGLSQGQFITAFVLPHGLLEIPAIAISGAVIFRIGATLVTPAQNQLISESWLRGLADWARIMLAVIIPLFFFASLIEAFITPRIMLMVLGQ